MTYTTKKFAQTGARQRGAALVVSLILLMMLTLLAISTMSTASLEVTMAGNDQFAENAFQLAESANEQFLQTIDGNTLLCVNNENPTVCDIPVTAVADPNGGPNLGTFNTQSRYVSDRGQCPGSSEGAVIRFNFELQAIGNSADNAVSQHTQGWFFCKL